MTWNDMTKGTLSVGTVTVGGTITEANSAQVASDTTSLDTKITACNTGAIAGVVTANISDVGAVATEATLAVMASDLDALTAAPVAKNPIAFTAVVATTGTSVPFMGVQTFARRAYVNARKKTGANTGLVYVGNSDVDKTTDQQFAVPPGEGIVLDWGQGTKIDMNKVWADAATSSDCVTGFYIPV